jgi:hypothetical protein
MGNYSNHSRKPLHVWCVHKDTGKVTELTSKRKAADFLGVKQLYKKGKYTQGDYEVHDYDPALGPESAVSSAVDPETKRKRAGSNASAAKKRRQEKNNRITAILLPSVQDMVSKDASNDSIMTFFNAQMDLPEEIKRGGDGKGLAQSFLASPENFIRQMEKKVQDEKDAEEKKDNDKIREKIATVAAKEGAEAAIKLAAALGLKAFE